MSTIDTLTLPYDGMDMIEWRNLDIELQDLIPKNKWTSKIWNHAGLSIITKNIMSYLCSIHTDITAPIQYVYYINDIDIWTRQFGLYNTPGIIILEAPKTRWNEERFTLFDITPKYLTGAEKLLQQNPKHFLKIFTVDNNDILFVYTNSPLSTENVYKLFEIQQNLFMKKYPNANDMPYRFIKAVVDKDLNSIKTILNEFIERDEIAQYKYELFKQSFDQDKTLKIQQCTNNIDKNRNDITYYENEIINLLNQIRELNEKIEFYQNKDDEDTMKQLYKYLNKHPYIKRYTCQTRRVIFRYEAPLIYYAETPVRKMASSSHINEINRIILNTFLDRRFTLYTQCELVVDTSTMRTSATTIGTDKYLGHPHLDRYHCFGNHSSILAQTIEKGDYFGYIEELSQMVLNLNFYDGCVIRTMLEELCLENVYNTVKTWYDNKTKEFITTAEMVERSTYEEAESNE